MLTLLISDVPGDDPSDIASGPTVGHAGSATLAIETLSKWDVTPPASVGAFLAAGGDPLAPDDERLTRVENVIIAAPSQSLDAAAEKAKAAGVEVRMLGDALEGEARDLAAAQAAVAIKIANEGLDHPVVLLSGGECTVTRRGNGVGGPNAEYTLAAAVALRGHPKIHVLACDTDGVDGAAEVAGAIADPTTGAQVVTGPTLTNVNDFRAILIMP